MGTSLQKQSEEPLQSCAELSWNATLQGMSICLKSAEATAIGGVQRCNQLSVYTACSIRLQTCPDELLSQEMVES